MSDDEHDSSFEQEEDTVEGSNSTDDEIDCGDEEEDSESDNEVENNQVDVETSISKSVAPNQPIAIRTAIAITQTSPVGMINVDWTELSEQFTSFYLCSVCKKASKTMACEKCVKYDDYPYNFVLIYMDEKYIIPAPKIASLKMKKFFLNLMNKIVKYHSYLEYLKTKRRTLGNNFYYELKSDANAEQLKAIKQNEINNLVDTLSKEQNWELFEEKYLEFIKQSVKSLYSLTVQQPISDGNIKEQLSGKTSFVRKKILGSKNRAIRLVCIIDTILGPDEVVIPHSIWVRINFKTQYCVVNRAPSINSECVFLQKVRYCENNHNVMRISALIAEGLHCDQDGDEVNLYIVEETNAIKSYTERVLYKEYSDATFQTGERCTFDYAPKADFGQYYNYMMYLYHDELETIWPGYTKLPCPKKQRPTFLMNLLCSSHYDYGVIILSKIFEFFRHKIVKTPTMDELFHGGDNIKALYESGSKGTKGHYDTYLKQIEGLSDEEYFQNAVAQFNRFIQSSTSLSSTGRNLFTKLSAFINVHIANNCLLYQNNVLVENVLDNPITLTSRFNKSSIKLVSDLLVKSNKEEDDIDDFISGFEKSKYI